MNGLQKKEIKTELFKAKKWSDVWIPYSGKKIYHKRQKTCLQEREKKKVHEDPGMTGFEKQWKNRTYTMTK